MIALASGIVQSVPQAHHEIVTVNTPVVKKLPAKLETKLSEPSAELTQDYKVKPQPVVQASSGGDIENIVRQAARQHGIDEDYFVKIARCESTLNPNSVNYNYNENGYPSGLFQHLSGYWPARAAKYGYPGASVFDATANANVTAAMFAEGQSGLWECN